MDWEAIGAVGEIVGALAVVASLAYLAAQIRQNTSQVREQNLSNRMNSLTAVGNGFTTFRGRVTDDVELSRLWAKGSQDLGSLTPDERGRFDYLCVDFFWNWGVPWLYVQQGVLDEDIWDFTSANLPLYARPGVRQWWFSSAYRTEYPVQFASLVDGLLNDSPDDPDAQHSNPPGAAL